MIILAMFLKPIWFIRQKIAECSESTGMILAPFFSESSFIKGHAITTDSLFASARSILFSRTNFEGRSPAAPLIPFTTISGSVSEIRRFIPSVPSCFVKVDLQLNSFERD